MKSTSLLLQAFEGVNKKVPVWFMRQAGRYLPEYQVIRKKYDLNVMFRTPELAAEITCQPVQILGVDAAILFADILTLPSQMGFDIYFDPIEGPVIKSNIALKDMHDFDNLDHVQKTIKLINKKLPKHIPLIGFAGSPFTVFIYLMGEGKNLNLPKTFKFIAQHPKEYHAAMKMLTKNSINYLNLQKSAGVDVFQLFDTWAGVLRGSDYAHWVLPYVKEIFDHIDLPSIYFVKNCNHLLGLMDQTSAQFISVDQTVVLGHHQIIEKTKKGIQGNLLNGLVYADSQTLKKEVHDVLVGGQKHGRFIFNLNHGCLPDTPVEKLKLIVNEVHAYPWKPLKNA